MTMVANAPMNHPANAPKRAAAAPAVAPKATSGDTYVATRTVARPASEAPARRLDAGTLLDHHAGLAHLAALGQAAVVIGGAAAWILLGDVVFHPAIALPLAGVTLGLCAFQAWNTLTYRRRKAALAQG